MVSLVEWGSGHGDHRAREKSLRGIAGVDDDPRRQSTPSARFDAVCTGHVLGEEEVSWTVRACSKRGGPSRHS